DYPAALNGYLRLLDGPDADRWLDEIALQTGELYRTVEITADGGAPRFSPDGGYFIYDGGRGISRVTRLARTEAPTTLVAEMPGFGATFSPDGSKLSYLHVDVTPEMLEIERAAAAASGTERTDLLRDLAALTEPAGRIRIRTIASGDEREIELGGRRKNAVVLAANDTIVFSGADADGHDQVYVMPPGREPVAVTTGEPPKILGQANATGTAVLFTERAPTRRAAGASKPPQFGVVSIPDGAVTTISGTAPAFSGDGVSLAYVTRTDAESRLMVAPAASPATGTAVRTGPERLDRPALTRDGSRLAYQLMAAHDWEVYTIDRDGAGERRLTREIQHDVLPLFLSRDRILAAIGEPRHRRSYLYDLSGAERTRLFHNNTVRTIAPEYDWAAHPGGTLLLVVSERDGDTVSPERGVYLIDLEKKVTREALIARLEQNLAIELGLRARGTKMFAPIEAAVRQVVGDASIARIYAHEKALFDFDSKHMTKPGNRDASAYLFDAYKSFGYEPEYQWLTHKDAHEGRTANVVATLKGTLNPELVYVVSSHYDSVAGGPGADDDSSGTAALLETARLLAKHPQPATIVFASFTGEESGLLGSREFVRRAGADKVRVAGALNNDMIGWANDHRLDNTIRYSNPGIRDVQHAAAMQFTRLITYDARYYKGTDAHAYYDAYGDIVGGIGSYPVLGNPHYHQPHDALETINHQLVTEVARTTAATLMLLASSPARLNGLTIDRYQNGAATVTWTPAAEKGIAGYTLTSGPAGAAPTQMLRVTTSRATIEAAPGDVVAVKAVNRVGLEGWDWARITVPAPAR
ncbi:MAG: M20/M25/M40 family metallo-hydrolase, partial [Vicinamibacterales bacterium]